LISFSKHVSDQWNAISTVSECYVQSSIEFRVLKLEFRALTE